MKKETANIAVSMIGPLPPAWGGGGKWLGGGVSSHMQGLLPRLGEAGVRIELLAENSSATRATRFPDLPEVEIQHMIRSPGRLALLLANRGPRLARRMAMDPILRQVPWAQRLRFLAQAANFDHFLEQAAGHLLHIQRAYHRQYLCQAVCQTTKRLLVTEQSVNLLVEQPPKWIEQMIRTNYRRADRLIAVSNFVKEKMIAYGADPARITVIPNGVDTQFFYPGDATGARQELGLPRDAFLILFSGNLIRRKGVDVLLRAFAQLVPEEQQPNLLVVGSGPEEGGLRTLTQELGIASAVSFVGRQPLSTMPRWYQAADLFVMPSWAEGLSLAVLEAMGAGLPVVTTRPDTGNHDAVVDGVTGLLTSYGAVDELSKALQLLLDRPTLTQEMGAAARRRAEESFEWEQIARATVDIYREMTLPSTTAK